MRCKKHYTDLSSTVGVCASCLRERLFSLIAAQAEAQAQAHARALAVEEKHRNSDTESAFPRSVSPYIGRRKSDNSATATATATATAAAWSHNHNHRQSRFHHHHHHSLPDHQFYSTPQIGPNSVGCIGGGGDSDRRKKHSFIRFSFFSNLFRSNNRNRNGAESGSDPRVSVSNSGESGGGNATSVTSSPSWFSSIVSGGRRKKHQFYIDYTPTTAAANVVRRHQCRDRGMSPARWSDDVGDEFLDGSSGYSSAESWKQTPRRTPATHHARRGGGNGGHTRNVSGLAFCLSPLVRASPNRHWSQKGMQTADGGLSGEIRAPVKPHLSYAKTFCANRSRKLADFGRFNPNR